MRRPFGRVFAAASFAFVALSGCAAPDHPVAEPVSPDPALPAAIDCTADDDAGWGRIPIGFDPVAVYVCDPALKFEPLTGSDGEPVAQPSIDPAPTRLEGDFGPLLRAFAEPNDPPWPGPCAAIMTIVPDVWLVDAGGRAVRPAYPLTGCSQPKEAVGDALALLIPAS